MTLLAKTSPASGASSLGVFAATLAPLFYGLCYGAPYADLGSSLDVLIGSLGSAGHALTSEASWLGKLCSFVPIGPLPLRIAFASTLASGLAARTLYGTIDLLLRAQGVAHETLIACVALGLCLYVFGMPMLFSTTLVPQAFALQSLLVLLVLAQLTRLESSFPSYDLRPLYAAALAFGFCIACDLRSALVLLPAAVPTLSRVLHAKGQGPLLRAAGMTIAVSACLHVALLTREHVYAGSALLAPIAAQSTSLLDVTFAYVQRYATALGLFGVLVGLGAVAALQTLGVRRIAMLWISAIIAPLGLYGLFAAAPEPQDGLGMLTYVLPASAVLAAALPGALLAPDGHGKPQASRAQLIAVLCMLLVGALRMHQSAVQSRISTFTFADTFADEGLHAVPSRSLVLLRDTLSTLPLMAAHFENVVRPDVELLPVALFDRAGSERAVATLAPQLRPLLRSYLLEGDFPAAELETLSGKRPVLLDASPSTAPALYATLRPSNLFVEVVGSSMRRAEERSAASVYLAQLARLHDELREHPNADGARRLLASHALASALYFAGTGDRQSARTVVDEARALAPRISLWDLLLAALGSSDARGPVEVTPFVPEDSVRLPL